MSQARTVVFDNEAVKRLLIPRTASIDVSSRRWRPSPHEISGAPGPYDCWYPPPFASRPAGTGEHPEWLCQPRAAALNRLRIDDSALDTRMADRASDIRTRLNVSAADAHLAASVGATPGPHAVLTSDSDDVRRIAKHLDLGITIVPV